MMLAPITKDHIKASAMLVAFFGLISLAAVGDMVFHWPNHVVNIILVVSGVVAVIFRGTENWQKFRSRKRLNYLVAGMVFYFIGFAVYRTVHAPSYYFLLILLVYCFYNWKFVDREEMHGIASNPGYQPPTS